MALFAMVCSEYRRKNFPNKTRKSTSSSSSSIRFLYMVVHTAAQAQHCLLHVLCCNRCDRTSSLQVLERARQLRCTSSASSSILLYPADRTDVTVNIHSYQHVMVNCCPLVTMLRSKAAAVRCTSLLAVNLPMCQLKATGTELTAPPDW